MNSLFYRRGSFLGSIDDYNSSRVVLMGAPMDYTVSYRPGARSGPEKIREVSEVLEEYSPLRDKEISEVKFFDAGDLNLPFGNVTKALSTIEKATKRCIEDEKAPFFLGGEHLISYPVVKEMYNYYKELRVIQFDAHADLRKEYLGEHLSHATVMRQICNLIGPEKVYQLGIRSGTKQEFEYGKKHTNFYPGQLLEAIDRVVTDCGDYPVYLTLDIDVFDPSYAPGTGTPEPGGHTSRELFKALDALQKLNVVGCDIVEVAPAYDQGDITAILAAKLVREFLLTFFT